MPSEQIDAASFSPDMREFLALLHGEEVRYLVVGGEAVIFHGYARLTGDLDVFYERSPENAGRLFASLLKFWQGAVPGVASAADFLVDGVIIQFGVPPRRLDLINRIDGVDFPTCWSNRRTVEMTLDNGDGVPVHYIGLRDLRTNKRAAGRPKDLDDLRFLGTD